MLPIRAAAAALLFLLAMPLGAQPRGLEPVFAKFLKRQGLQANAQNERLGAQALLKSALPAASSTPASAPPPGKHIADGVMVRFSAPEAALRAARNEPPPEALARAVHEASGYQLRYRRPMAMGMFVFDLAQPMEMDAALALAERLGALPGIAAVELDVRLRSRAIPNDPYFNLQHSLLPSTVVRGGIDAVGAWDVTTGSGRVVVAVLDSGVTAHAEFVGRLLPGYDFVSTPFNANDGDGRDANPADPGSWVTASEAQQRGCDRTDSSWHGTHVAGIIGANGNNGYGVAGIDWMARLLPVRVLGKCGGTTSDVIDGLLWAAGLPVQGAPANLNPAHVINMSLGVYSPSGCSAVFQAAIGQVKARGALIVVAAGNESDEAARYVPASCPGVITVGSVDKLGFHASYSNYSTQFKVAVSAPGGDSFYGETGLIPSTTNTGTTTPDREAFVYMEGTSMAAPHVAGAASLALAANAELTGVELSALLLTTSHEFDPRSMCATQWPICGAGIVNAASMVAGAKALLPYRTVSEFYNPDYGHYFRTGDRDEPAIVESGALGNWRNTEEYFIAWRDGSQGASPVCRFYSKRFNSHFYTVLPAECEAVKANPDWAFEGIAFYAYIPHAGNCPPDTTLIYRFYNNRHAQNDGNHRLTPYKDYYMQSMIRQGWSYEGVVMCVVA